MTFEVSAAAYGRFMGRFAEPLADRFVELAELRPGRTALDVGCGPGALTHRLVDLLGPDAVCAVDPSASFVAAAAALFPGVDVRHGVAEDLPFEDDRFDAALAQLVVHFMTDPVAGIAGMARVTRPGGLVAACVWDHAGGTGPVATFWRAVHELDPGADSEAGLPGVREGHLAELFGAAGLHRVRSGRLTVLAPYDSFEDWWGSYQLGIGPAGEYVARLDDAHRAELRAHCAHLMPDGPFEVPASAWYATGRA